MSDEKWKCPKCGTENDAENAFCGECGSKKPERETRIAAAGRVIPKETKPEPAPVQDMAGEKPKSKKGVIIAFIVVFVTGIIIAVVLGGSSDQPSNSGYVPPARSEQPSNSEYLQENQSDQQNGDAESKKTVVKERKTASETRAAAGEAKSKKTAVKERKAASETRAAEAGEAKSKKASVGKAKVDGAVDSASVANIIKISRAAVKRCYDKALIDDPALKGQVVVTILINEKGRVESIEISKDTLGNTEVTKCIKGVVGRLRFPSQEGGPVSVTFPFIFSN